MRRTNDNENIRTNVASKAEGKSLGRFASVQMYNPLKYLFSGVHLVSKARKMIEQRQKL